MQITPHNPLEGPQPDLTINLHDGSEESVSIIIVHKDRPEYLNILIQSIAVTSMNNNYEIIVSDNASGKESQEFLDVLEKEGIKIIRNDKNLYWSEAANKAAKLANKHSKYLIFLHCDVVVLSSGWMDLLINISEANKSGYVGTELGSYYLQSQKVDYIQEWCLLMTRECWEDCKRLIGSNGFPEELPQIGHSFIMSLAANKAGHSPKAVKNTICHHYRIFSLDINEYEKLTEQAMVMIPKLIAKVT